MPPPRVSATYSRPCVVRHHVRRPVAHVLRAEPLERPAVVGLDDVRAHGHDRDDVPVTTTPPGCSATLTVRVEPAILEHRERSRELVADEDPPVGVGGRVVRVRAGVGEPQLRRPATPRRAGSPPRAGPGTACRTHETCRAGAGNSTTSRGAPVAASTSARPASVAIAATPLAGSTAIPSAPAPTRTTRPAGCSRAGLRPGSCATGGNGSFGPAGAGRSRGLAAAGEQCQNRSGLAAPSATTSARTNTVSTAIDSH